MATTKRNANELSDGDLIVLRVSGVRQTTTGHVIFTQSAGQWQGSDQIEYAPPDAVFTVIAAPADEADAAPSVP